jgi:hypothetical protein
MQLFGNLMYRMRYRYCRLRNNDCRLRNNDNRDYSHEINFWDNNLGKND